MRPKVILAVEDDRDTREILVEVLREFEGWVVCSAGSVEDALRIASGVRPDLVLLDLYIPALEDGCYCGAELRRRLGDSLAIIVTSGAHPSKCTDALKQFRSDAFLAKPYDIVQLVELLRRFLHMDAMRTVC